MSVERKLPNDRDCHKRWPAIQGVAASGHTITGGESRGSWWAQTEEFLPSCGHRKHDSHRNLVLQELVSSTGEKWSQVEATDTNFYQDRFHVSCDA